MRGDYVYISPAQIVAGGGQQDIDYVLDRPPFTRYFWNGTAFQELGGGGGSGLTFPSPVLSASAVVKGVAGDPGYFIGVLCTSVSGGKVTIRDGGTVSGALIPGLGSGGASGLAMTAGQYLSLGGPVYCANGIYLEISGTVSVVVLYQ